ncbi:hypothetical protein GCM10009858_24200 [Terrabacter carboxydivorans]|uniref:Uncharacterized protein n=1 Tax=Terrabacter carboxydivorans TaxID=619730 RepID=A0ABN3LJP3_9MICO
MRSPSVAMRQIVAPNSRSRRERPSVSVSRTAPYQAPHGVGSAVAPPGRVTWSASARPPAEPSLDRAIFVNEPEPLPIAVELCSAPWVTADLAQHIWVARR